MARRTSASGRPPSATLPTGDPILVTGATGFVGSAVLRALVQRGETVRVLARPSSPRRNLDGVACEVVEGDMTDAASMAKAMAGGRYLYHVAAAYRLWAPHPGEVRRANLRGAEATMAAARAAFVERILHPSSVATLRAADAATVV